MTFLAWFFGTICFLICAIIFLGYKQEKSKKREIADWQVGDCMIMQNGLQVELYAWSTDEIIIRHKDSVNAGYDIWQKEWHEFFKNDDGFPLNKSAKWRRINDRCKKTMKSENDVVNAKVRIHNEVTNTVKPVIKSDLLNGKSVEELNETECHTYLPIAVAAEEYELAEAIRERLATVFR